MNNSFSDLVRRLNELSKEETTDDIVESAESTSIVEAKKDVEEDIVGDIRSRYSNFLKSEAAQGNDLNTVATTVAETNISAAKLDRAFASTYKVMEQLLELTSENSKLTGSVIAEGGDISYIQAANERLAEAFAALKEAHMYAVKQVEVD